MAVLITPPNLDSLPPPPPSLPRWTAESAWKWYNAQPYLCGANFIPSNAINQLEMWQAETFDPTTIERELHWASQLGLNVMRVYLHDLLWEQNSAEFCARIDKFLSIASRHGIRTLLVLFDDCWNAEFALGPQPAPKPCKHNSGWVQSPGKKVVNNPDEWPRLERYVKGVLTHFKEDPRILAWDLYNEPGNGSVGDASANAGKQGRGSLPLLHAVFKWARAVPRVIQPITVGVWNFAAGYEELNAYSLENSDLISFHNYGAPQDLAERIKALTKTGRPLLCTEYMCRGLGSTFEFCLPILAKNKVAALNWGLVAGKTQTIYPWGWNAEKGEPPVWFHDIFHTNGTLLYPNEGRVFEQVLRAKK